MTWRTLLLMAVSSVFVSLASAQTAATPDSSGIPDLNGRWLLTQGRGGNMVTVTFIQTGTQVEANLRNHVRCLGDDVVMQMNLHGNIRGSQLQLQVTDAQVEGAFRSPCNTAEWAGHVDFRGEISPQADEIKGHYDNTQSVFSLWVFKRPAKKKKREDKN